MSSVQPGERTFTIGDGNVRLARGVHLVRAIPSEVRLDFERHAEREVKVVPRFTGEQSGYAIARYGVEPNGCASPAPPATWPASARRSPTR